MTRTELAMGSATLIAIIAAGASSARWVDRHYAAAVAAERSRASDDGREPQASSPSAAPCVGADGSWKNWVWANVPMLSPKCGER